MVRRSNLGPATKRSNRREADQRYYKKRRIAARKKVEEELAARATALASSDSSQSEEEEEEDNAAMDQDIHDGDGEALVQYSDHNPQLLLPHNEDSSDYDGLRLNLSDSGNDADPEELPSVEDGDQEEEEDGQEVHQEHHEDSSSAEEDGQEGHQEHHEDSSSAEDEDPATGQLIPPSFPISYDQQPEDDDSAMEFYRAITSVKARSDTSDAALDKIIRVIVSRKATFNRLADEGKLSGSYRKNVKKKVMEGLPKIWCAVLVEDNSGESPTISYQRDLKTVPADLWKNRLQNNRILLRQEAYTTVAEIKKFHKKVCMSQGLSEETFQEQCQHLSLSADGVRETKNGKRNFVFVTVRFGTAIYIVKVYNPLLGVKQAKPDPDTMLRDLLEEIAQDEELQLQFVIADKPERHSLKGLVAHAGKHSCEVCEATATTVPATHWPLNTMGGKLRREQDMKHAALNLDDIEIDHKGVQAYTPLYEVPAPFSVIWSIPSDEFHLLKEGLTKLIIKRLFEDSNTLESRQIFTKWSEIYEKTLCFSETARRTRKISTGQMKGSEFGLILFSAFPSLIVILEEYRSGHWVHAQKAIAVLCFVAKAYNMDNDKLQVIQDTLRRTGLSLPMLHKAFYRSFTHGMCKRQKHRQTANVHAFFHLHQSRVKSGVPLYVTSAEPFEALYAVVRRSFKPGTRNTPLQAMENGYLRILHTSFHGRRRRLVLKTNQNNASVRDNLVVTKDGTVVELVGEERKPWKGRPLILSPFEPNCGINLPWHLVGVYVYEGIDHSMELDINDDDLEGKAICSTGLITTWSRQMMMSKVDD